MLEHTKDCLNWIYSGQLGTVATHQLNLTCLDSNMPTMMPEIVGAQQHHGALLAAAVAANTAMAPQDTTSTITATSNNTSSATSSSPALSTNTNTTSASVAAADAEAREWWAQREAKVERELYSGLLKRMDTQRKQVIAFKAEQSKWENRLQVRPIALL